MTMIFTDSFDAGDFTSKWDFYINNANFTTTTDTRFGSGLAVVMNTNTAATPLLRKSFTAAAKVVCGFAHKYAVTADTANVFTVQGDAGATIHLGLRLLTTGQVALYRGSTLIATSASPTPLHTANTNHYYEVSATIADAGGTAEVRVDGVSVLTFTGDTKNGGTNNTIDTVAFWFASSNGVPTFDDVYILNGLGATNNNFLGDVRIQPLRPNATGSSTQLTPVGTGTNYQNVDEVAPDSADYNYSSTAGHRDLYGLEDVLAGTSAVKAVQVCSIVRKTDSGVRSMKNLVRSGATTTAGATTAVGTSAATIATMFDVNPTTAAAWAVGDIAALEAGVEVV